MSPRTKPTVSEDLLTPNLKITPSSYLRGNYTVAPSTPLLELTPTIKFVPKARDDVAVEAFSETNQSVYAINNRNQRESPLLRLPDKVRKKIFEIVFTMDTLIELRTSAPTAGSKLTKPTKPIYKSEHEDKKMNKIADSWANDSWSNWWPSPGSRTPSPDFSETSNARDLSPEPLFKLSSEAPVAIDIHVPTEMHSNPFALLLTSRQIYDETHLLPYALNVFHCATLWDLGICLSRLQPEHRDLISLFVIRWHTAEGIIWEKEHPKHVCKGAQNALGLLGGLKTLAVDKDSLKGLKKRVGNPAVWNRMRVDLEAWLKKVGMGGVEVIMY